MDAVCGWAAARRQKAGLQGSANVLFAGALCPLLLFYTVSGMDFPIPFFCVYVVQLLQKGQII